MMMNIRNLLSRIRTLVRMVRKFRNICSYAQLKIRQDDSLNSIMNFIVYSMEFKIFNAQMNNPSKGYAINMTEKPSRIKCITNKQIKKIRNLNLSVDKWSIY